MKLAIGLIVAVLCWINRNKPVIPPGLFMAITLLTVSNIAIAVFWQ